MTSSNCLWRNLWGKVSYEITSDRRILNIRFTLFWLSYALVLVSHTSLRCVVFTMPAAICQTKYLKKIYVLLPYSWDPFGVPWRAVRTRQKCAAPSCLTTASPTRWSSNTTTALSATGPTPPSRSTDPLAAADLTFRRAERRLDARGALTAPVAVHTRVAAAAEPTRVAAAAGCMPVAAAVEGRTRGAAVSRSRGAAAAQRTQVAAAGGSIRWQTCRAWSARKWSVQRQWSSIWLTSTSRYTKL